MTETVGKLTVEHLLRAKAILDANDVPPGQAAVFVPAGAKRLIDELGRRGYAVYGEIPIS
jgi:hypothetical protein